MFRPIGKTSTKEPTLRTFPALGDCEQFCFRKHTHWSPLVLRLKVCFGESGRFQRGAEINRAESDAELISARRSAQLQVVDRFPLTDSDEWGRARFIHRVRDPFRPRSAPVRDLLSGMPGFATGTRFRQKSDAKDAKTVR